MSDADLVRLFESGATPGDSFHHADHVRLAFAYLTQYPVLEALARFSSALRRLAVARGKTRLYHETITCAFIFLINERRERSGTSDWERFARENPDLFVWKDGILSRYYSNSTLESDFARRVFVLPDISDRSV